MELKDIYLLYPTKEDCIEHLEKLRWDVTPCCPYCSSGRYTSSAQASRYHCNNCNTSYSVTVNTLFHKTRLDLQKWFLAIKIVFSSVEKVSSRNLAKRIDVTKDTAWRVLQEINNARLKQDDLINKIIEYGRK